MAVRGVTEQLSDMTNRYSYTRTGVVVLVDPFLVTVDVGGTQLRAAYSRSVPPRVGETVVLARQAASWFVIGTSSTTGGNSVVNPSFEEVDAGGSQPSSWVVYRQTGSADVSVEVYDRAVEGSTALHVSGGSASSLTWVYSDPIQVAPGQQWTLSAYANGAYGGQNVNTTACALVALWFVDSAILYPTVSDPVTVVQNAVNIAETDTMQLLQGNATVPANSFTMRVCVRTATNAYAGAMWDFATARRT